LHCPKCFKIFESSDQDQLLKDHLRQDECIVLSKPADSDLTLDWIDESKKAELRKRKSIWGLSEQEKWKGIWKVLFPMDSDAEIPDAEIDELVGDAQILDSCKAYLAEHLANRMKTRMEAIVDIIGLKRHLGRIATEHVQKELHKAFPSELDKLFEEFKNLPQRRSANVTTKNTMALTRLDSTKRRKTRPSIATSPLDSIAETECPESVPAPTDPHVALLNRITESLLKSTQR
jgi:hypothetical protein